MNSKKVLETLKLLGVKDIKNKPSNVYSSYKENKYLVLDNALNPIILEKEEWKSAPFEDKILSIYHNYDPEYNIYRFIYDTDFDPYSMDEDGMNNFLGTISKEDLEKNGITITSKEEE